MKFSELFWHLRENFKSLSVGIGTNVGGSEYCTVTVPGSDISIRIQKSVHLRDRYDIVDPDGDTLHLELEFNELVAMTRHSFLTLAK
jgi:hypothetical protein